MTEPDKTEERQGGRFKPGQSGNPAGRPVGAQNKATLFRGDMTPETLKTLEELDRPSLVALIKKVAGAMWGIGLMTQEEREDAILFKLASIALTSSEGKEVVATAKEYFDRMRGKPAQSVQMDANVNVVTVNATVTFVKPLPVKTIEG